MNVVDSIINAGIVGAGGAGFPTHEKLGKEVEYLIVNAAECEPLLQSDQFIMRCKADRVIKGIEYVLDTIKAKKATIVTKKKYKREVEQLKLAVSRSKYNIEICQAEGFYPLGDEQILVQMVTGCSVPGGGIPLDVSCVTLNVTTVSQIADAVDDSKPVTEKIITVLGEVVHPGLINVSIGTSIRRCIEACGGAKNDKYCIIIGGPMMGNMISGEESGNRFVTKTDSALIVLSEDHYIARRKQADIGRIIKQAKTACIQCRYCTDMCPRYLIGHKLQPHLIMRTVDGGTQNVSVLKEALICSECGVCEMYACPMGLSPRMVNVYLKGILRKSGTSYTKQTGEVFAKEEINGRRIPTERLLARLCLSKYGDTHFDSVNQVDTDEVTIYLKQHIGVPAKPVVKQEEFVDSGQLIAMKDGFGANIHSSINGKVKEVTNSYIKVIRKDAI